MIEAIVEVWCSPLRGEEYSVKILPLFAGYAFQVEDEIREYINAMSGNFLIDAFGEEYYFVKGLWKVVFKIGVDYVKYDSWGVFSDYDVEFTYTEMFKGQCSSWTDVKYTWMDLKEGFSKIP